MSSNKPKIFARNKTTRDPVHKGLLAIDVENNSHTGKFINAALYGYVQDHHGNERHVKEFFDDQTKLHKYLLSLKKPEDKNIPCILIFYNLSYDYWFLSDIADDSAMLSSGTNIITGKLTNGIPMLDLTNQVKGSLEDWIGYLNMEEKFGIKKESLSDLKKRVESDARATYELGHFIEDFYVNELGIPLKLTVASSARYLFALHYFTGLWYRKQEQQWLSDYEREGYRGGRVEVFKRGDRFVESYDENSEYLSVMQREMMPNPNSARWHNSKDSELFNIDALIETKTLFIADVTVEVPPQHIPPLPYRDTSNPNSKLIFRTGVFRGKYYSPELIVAVKQCGVIIKKVHSYVTYESHPYFKRYADFIWKKRKEYKDKHNKGMDILMKYLGNTLYGGFGQRNTKYSFFGKLKDFHGYIEPGNDPQVTIINNTKYISVSDNHKDDSSHTFPCIPGFITSYARVDLFNVLKANEDIAVYCDTDSVKVECKPYGNILDTIKNVSTGHGLGQWGFEYRKSQIFFKPKMYADKNKGVPDRAQLVYEDALSRTYVYRKPNKMKESFRRGNLIPAQWDYVVKDLTLLDDKRDWSEDGLESEPIGCDM